jgi:dTDP-4-amino-4,6-dideoxygalactose transaminase
MARLEERGIATRPGTHAAAMQGYYAAKYDIDRSDFPRACIAEQLSMALPLFPQMDQSDLEYVAESLVEAGEDDS